MADKFHRWTPARRAKFVEYRFAGLHTEWAVYWACVDRSKVECYPQEMVDRYLRERPEWPFSHWLKPMTGRMRDKHIPPQELFDQLAETA